MCRNITRKSPDGSRCQSPEVDCGCFYLPSNCQYHPTSSTKTLDEQTNRWTILTEHDQRISFRSINPDITGLRHSCDRGHCAEVGERLLQIFRSFWKSMGKKGSALLYAVTLMTSNERGRANSNEHVNNCSRRMFVQHGFLRSKMWCKRTICSTNPIRCLMRMKADFQTRRKVSLFGSIRSS